MQGCTPLHLAADNNKDEAAKRLVHYGADLNKLDMVISPPARVDGPRYVRFWHMDALHTRTHSS